MLQDKFQMLASNLKGVLVERDREIDGALLALASGSTLFMLGEPGVAKSMLPALVAQNIEGVNYFDILFTRFTQPDEVFGPLSISSLEQDRFEHKLDGYLATADMMMGDEIFKANSSILNALLWAINERKYRHGDKVIDIPLTTGFFASNELPQDSSLEALYDRLVLRYEVTRIKDSSNFAKVLQTVVPSDPTPVISWGEVREAQEEVKKVALGPDLIEGLTSIRKDLDEQGIESSDRRFVQAVKVIRAAAWLDGCDVADLEHLSPLENVLWRTPDQIDTVAQVVLKIANPYELEVISLISDIRDLNDSLDDVDSSADRTAIGAEVNRKVTAAREELGQLAERIGTNPNRQSRLREARDALSAVGHRILVEVYMFDEETATSLINKEEGTINPLPEEA